MYTKILMSAYYIHVIPINNNIFVISTHIYISMYTNIYIYIYKCCIFIYELIIENPTPLSYEIQLIYIYYMSKYLHVKLGTIDD